MSGVLESVNFSEIVGSAEDHLASRNYNEEELFGYLSSILTFVELLSGIISPLVASTMAAHYGYNWTYVGFGISAMVFVLNYATVCGLGRTEEEKKLKEDQLKEDQSDEEVLMVNTS
jgi:dipeptide/tripeptide permease